MFRRKGATFAGTPARESWWAFAPDLCPAASGSTSLMCWVEGGTSPTWEGEQPTCGQAKRMAVSIPLSLMPQFIDIRMDVLRLIFIAQLTSGLLRLHPS